MFSHLVKGLTTTKSKVKVWKNVKQLLTLNFQQLGEQYMNAYKETARIKTLCRSIARWNWNIGRTISKNMLASRNPGIELQQELVELQGKLC